VQVLKKCDDWERRTGYFRWKKRGKNEIHVLGWCRERQTISLIAFIFGMLVNVGKKIVCLQCSFKSDVSREILTVIMTSYYKNVWLCKRHGVVCRTFCFGDSLCSFLALQLTTMSLDITDHGGLGFSAQQYHPKTSLTFPIQQFCSFG